MLNTNTPYYPLLQELSYIRPMRMLSPNAFVGGAASDPYTQNSCPTGWDADLSTITCAGTTAIAGTGPWKFESRTASADSTDDDVQDDLVVFAANADYWGGAPDIEELRVVRYDWLPQSTASWPASRRRAGRGRPEPVGSVSAVRRALRGAAWAGDDDSRDHEHRRQGGAQGGRPRREQESRHSIGPLRVAHLAALLAVGALRRRRPHAQVRSTLRRPSSFRRCYQTPAPTPSPVLLARRLQAPCRATRKMMMIGRRCRQRRHDRAHRDPRRRPRYGRGRRLHHFEGEGRLPLFMDTTTKTPGTRWTRLTSKSRTPRSPAAATASAANPAVASFPPLASQRVLRAIIDRRRTWPRSS